MTTSTRLGLLVMAQDSDGLAGVRGVCMTAASIFPGYLISSTSHKPRPRVAARRGSRFPAGAGEGAAEYDGFVGCASGVRHDRSTRRAPHNFLLRMAGLGRSLVRSTGAVFILIFPRLHLRTCDRLHTSTRYLRGGSSLCRPEPSPGSCFLSSAARLF